MFLNWLGGAGRAGAGRCLGRRGELKIESGCDGPLLSGRGGFCSLRVDYGNNERGKLFSLRKQARRGTP